ncbi:phosphate ABC transporter substrate-binding/OmpA family protein [Falsihalocynthiibacter arcticus]|uniref:phosphate ABC transporter substrate-binding/OmpA family protein n=1 Tax=Falsihalocynthiibacter arcticus TaxID=1579316 RepID=UPI0009ED1813|nr:phosphate ABC transporter substrate-binding/OmpA family protein [Falsihalocynthiibacter arcticus]
MNILRAAVCAALFVFTPLLAHSQDVTLSSLDGGVTLSGALVSYDGEFYRVDTEYGVLTLDGSGVYCSGPACPNLEGYVAELSIAGAQGVAGTLLPSLFERFAQKHGYDAAREVTSDTDFTIVLAQKDGGTAVARIQFDLGTSDYGMEQFLAEDADLAVSLREATAAEQSKAIETGLGNLNLAKNARILGLDGVIPIIAKNNPVAAISLGQLSKVLSGEISNWQELGGIDVPIELHLRGAGAGLLQKISSELLTPDQQFAPSAQRHTRDEALSDAVSRSPFALGLTSLSSLGNSVPMSLLGGCGFPFQATHEAVKTEDYPLTAPLFLYVPNRRFPKVIREFFAFLSTPEAAQIVADDGFVNQTPLEIPMNSQGERLANAILQAGEETSLSDLQEMVAELRDGQRVTTTFRFEPGSSRLDAQSRANVERLAEVLEAGIFGDRSVTFVGFSDGDGGAAANRKIALRRAQVVEAAVLREATLFDPNRMGVTSKGFGEAMPMACDETEWGSKVNRRVEAWLGPIRPPEQPEPPLETMQNPVSTNTLQPEN